MSEDPMANVAAALGTARDFSQQELELIVKHCARCRGDHAVKFKPLLNPPPNSISHFAICPTTSQPIWMTVYDH